MPAEEGSDESETGQSGGSPPSNRRPFDATFVGHVTQSQDENGYVTVTIDAVTHRGFAGRLHLAIRGVPLDEGGVQMEDSVVGLLRTGAPAWAAGHITALSGTNIGAAVHDSNGRTLHLRLSLNLDPVSDAVTGSLHAGASPADGTLPTLAWRPPTRTAGRRPHRTRCRGCSPASTATGARSRSASTSTVTAPYRRLAS